MSQNIRPVGCSSGLQGRVVKVVGSGTASMSDSSIGLKPVIEEPSKPVAAREGVLELGGVDREALELAEDVREPEADEADVALGDLGDHVLGGRRARRGRVGAAHLAGAPWSLKAAP